MNDWSPIQTRSDRWIERIVRAVVLFLGRRVYRVRVKGAEHLPDEGGVLLVCNHVSYADTIPLTLASPRKLRFTSFEGLFGVPILGRGLKAFGSIPVSPGNARCAIRRTVQCLKAGEAVALFPEGKLTLDGKLQPVREGFQVIARQADCPVVMAHIDGLWGSIFSNERGRYFFKWPRIWRRDVTITFAQAGEIPDGDVLTDFWRECVRGPELAATA